MIIEVRVDSPVPPYEQIREQIVAMIASDVLPEGARLPAIRQLAGDLRLASGTVARAYRELEAEGAIVTQGRKGTFVSRPPKRSSEPVQLQDAARSFALRARQLGADPEVALGAVRSALDAF